MIHYIKVRNFMSFKDEVCLDFEATDDTRFEDYHVVKMADGTRLLRFAVLYGANASGKSNLVKALQFIFNYWNNTEANPQVGTIPFLFDKQTPNEATEFEIAFYVDNNRYVYLLKIHGNTTKYEELILDTEKPISIVKREQTTHSEVRFNPDILSEEISKTYERNCLPQMSFFAARNKVNLPAIPHFDAVRQWITQTYLPPITHDTNLNDYWQKRLNENNNDQLKNYILNFIQKADFNISNIDCNIEYQQLHPFYRQSISQDNTLSEQEKKHLLAQKLPVIKTVFRHNIESEAVNDFNLPIQLQSDGTLRTIALATVIHDITARNAFVSIDEIEASLHPELVQFIINKFIESETTHNQMLITTHYTDLLDTIDDMLRRDNIWFVEKQKNGCSDLYSLVEFKDTDDMEHINSAYKYGCFGAIPHLR